MKLVEMAIAAVGVQQIAGRARTAAKAAAISAIAGLVGLVGAGFLTAGLWTYLAQSQGSVAASLWVGAGFVVLALIVLVVGRSMAGAAPAPVRNVADSQPLPDLNALLGTAGKTAQDQFNAPGGASQTAALVALAGFVIGRLLKR